MTQVSVGVRAVRPSHTYDRPIAARRPLVSLGAAGLLASGAVLAHLPAEVGLPCPVLALTGVPCPLCGMTTSVRNVMGLRFGHAAAANPFGFLVVAASLLVIAVPWTYWGALKNRLDRITIILGAGGLALGSWLFELARFHIL